MPDSPDIGAGMTPDRPKIIIDARGTTKDVPPPEAPKPEKPWSERPFGEVLSAYQAETDPDIKKQQKDRIQSLFDSDEGQQITDAILAGTRDAVETSTYMVDVRPKLDSWNNDKVKQIESDNPHLAGLGQEAMRIARLKLEEDETQLRVKTLKRAGKPTKGLEDRLQEIKGSLDASDYWQPPRVDFEDGLCKQVNISEFQRRINASPTPNDYLIRQRNKKIDAAVASGYVDMDEIKDEIRIKAATSSKEDAVSNLRDLADKLEQRAASNPGYADKHSNVVKTIVEGAAVEVDTELKRASGHLDDDTADDILRRRNRFTYWNDRSSLLAEVGSRVDKTSTAPGTSPELTEAAEKLTEAAQMFTSSERGLDLPSSPEDQRLLVRGILDGIENSHRDCLDYANAQIVRKLEISTANMSPEVADEVQVRLKLHDSSELVKQAGGWIQRKDAGYTIGSAATEAERRGHGLDQRTAEVCLVEGLPGLNIAEAWDLLQKANQEPDSNDPVVGYSGFVREVNIQNLDKIISSDPDRKINKRAMLRELEAVKFDPTKLKTAGAVTSVLNEYEINSFFSTEGTEAADADSSLGQVPTNFQTDSDVRRKKAVRNLLVQKLTSTSDGQPMDRKGAAKSLQLAEKLAIGSLETSIWNRSALAGNDELAECIGFKEWRSRRRVAGRARGPAIHEEFVDELGSSWLRPKREDEYGLGNPKKPLFAKDVDTSKITAGDWQAHCTVRLNRYYQVKELFLDRAPKPPREGGINQNLLRAAVPYFNEVDPPGKINSDTGKFEKKHPDDENSRYAGKPYKTGDKLHKVWWLAGVIDITAADINLGWTVSDLNELYAAVVKDKLSDEAGSFIDQVQWDWIMENTNAISRLAQLDTQRTLRGIFGLNK